MVPVELEIQVRTLWDSDRSSCAYAFGRPQSEPNKLTCTRRMSELSAEATALPAMIGAVKLLPLPSYPTYPPKAQCAYNPVVGREALWGADAFQQNLCAEAPFCYRRVASGQGNAVVVYERQGGCDDLSMKTDIPSQRPTHHLKLTLSA